MSALSLVVVMGLASSAVEVPPCSPSRAPLEPFVDVKDGRKVAEGNLRAGAREGRWTFYWPNGFKKEESLYCNGVRHGATTFWYETGFPELEGTFEHGAPRGAWTFWDEKNARRLFYPKPARLAHDFFLDEGSRALVADDLPLAGTLLRIALRNAPNEPRVHRALGVLSAKTGEGPKAAFHYRRYIELEPAARDRATVESFLRAYEAARATPTTGGPTSPPPGGGAAATPTPSPTATASSSSTATPVVTTPVAIVTDRPARVVVDGRLAPGLTPLDGNNALALTPGVHRVVLEIDGTPPITQALEVYVEGKPAPARIELVVGERFIVEGPITVQPLAN